MADQSWISSLIEALRGGNTPKANSRYGTYNPPPRDPNRPPKEDSLLSAGVRDPEYAAYLKGNPPNPKPYMRWLEEGE